MFPLERDKRYLWLPLLEHFVVKPNDTYDTGILVTGFFAVSNPHSNALNLDFLQASLIILLHIANWQSDFEYGDSRNAPCGFFFMLATVGYTWSHWLVTVHWHILMFRFCIHEFSTSTFTLAIFVLCLSSSIKKWKQNPNNGNNIHTDQVSTLSFWCATQIVCSNGRRWRHS